MARSTKRAPISLDEADLQLVAKAIAMRCPRESAEAARAARMRALVRVTGDLSRTLSLYARHALVNCQGTVGAWDLAADTDQLAGALIAFCAEMRAVSREYGDVVRADVVGVVPSHKAAPEARKPDSSAPRFVVGAIEPGAMREVPAR